MKNHLKNRYFVGLFVITLGCHHLEQNKNPILNSPKNELGTAIAESSGDSQFHLQVLRTVGPIGSFEAPSELNLFTAGQNEIEGERIDSQRGSR